MEEDIFFSVDCEFDGPIPGPYSMLSFGSVAFTLREGIVGEYYANLFPLEGATTHPSNQKFWNKNPEAYKATLVSQQSAEIIMPLYSKHINIIMNQQAEAGVTKRPIFAEYPGGVDFQFVRWYFYKFANECPFGFASWSAKSYISAVQKTSFRGTAKRTMNPEWFNKKLNHTHHALDDAREQAHLFIMVLCEHLDLPEPKNL